MKKTGFTLAEVLITLTIIGVVAALTLPSLMSNTSEQQQITAYRKAINSLSEAGQMNGALNGYDYSTAQSVGSNLDADIDSDASIVALLANRLNVDKSVSGSGKIGAGACTSTFDVIFRDGTAICLPTNGNPSTNGYVTAWIDVNGVTGPNRQSTCKEAGCTTKKDKKIYDQFPVTLYGGSAIPAAWSALETIDTGKQTNNYAASYAMGAKAKTKTSGGGSAS